MPISKLLYWDSCMFYEVLGDEKVEPRKKAAIQDLLEENKNEGNLIVTSVITHLEVLPTKLGQKGADDEADYLALFDAIHFLEIEVSSNVILRAREIRDFYYRAPDHDGKGAKMMDLGDAIHLATASINGIHEFHTRDNKTRKGNVPLLDLYRISGNSRLCGKYDLTIESPESPQGKLDV